MRNVISQYQKVAVKELPNTVPQNPTVSVCVQTYQHVNYIKQCLEGIITQKTDFPYEILLGDDESTDGTRDICKDYAEKYPDKIIFFLHCRENNIQIGGQPTGRFNFLYNLSQSHGKYIAMCEGDDYWTDPLKLQKQVDILEGNIKYSGCTHQSVRFDENSQQESLFGSTQEEEITTTDLIDKRRFHTASLLFRAEIIAERGIPVNIAAADKALFFLISLYGPIKYLKESMCVYRKNSQGISSRVTSEMLLKDLNIIPWLKQIDPDFPQCRLLSNIHRTIITYPQRVKISSLIKHYFLYLFYSFARFPKNLRPLLAFSLLKLPILFYNGIMKK